MAAKKTTAAKTADKSDDQNPAVGDVVIYNPTGQSIGKPRAAVVTDVNEEKDTVDLIVFALNGVGTTFLRNVKLDQPQERPEDAPEDWKPTPVEHTWAWPARV